MKGTSRIFVITLLWCIIIIIKILFPDSLGDAHNNGYYISLCGIVCFILYPSIIVGSISVIILMVLLYFSRDILHPFLDAAKIIMCLCALKIGIDSRFTGSERKMLFYIVSAFVIVDLLGMGIPSLYNETGVGRSRYAGVLYGTNISATVFGLSQIVICELNNKKKNAYLYFNFIIFVFMALFSGTRSLLFFLPYWLIQFYTHINKKIFYFGCIAIGLIVVKSIVDVFTMFRLEEDGSFLTRSFLYRTMIDGIMDNKMIIPHGSNSANLLSKFITSNDDYAAHNDFLLLLYDWGIIFIILMVYSYKQIKNNVNVNWKYLTIVIAWSSAALHNAMLLPVIFLLFIIASNLYFTNRESVLQRVS